jgi:DNA-directed RNA polymerase subunit RPC12/RpoP
MTTAPLARTPDKFALDKATFGGITLLTLQGTLNDDFEGRKVAESAHSKKLVISMRHVRRFASWGMSEWMDFLRITATSELYLVECSTYAVSQINLVTGLLGHARLVSFYASYRCSHCNAELETLFVVPRDRSTIRELPSSYQICTACNGQARLEEYPAAFFDMIADRPSFDIDDEVLAFFRSYLHYDLAPDLSRFRAFRRVHKGYTYFRLSGSADNLPSEVLATASEGTAVADLSGLVFDPAHLAAWRAYVRAALPRVTSLQLQHCPLGFVEHATSVEELRGKLKIRSFALSYDCLRCETTSIQMTDVAENLEQLVNGIAPNAICAVCRSSLIANLSPEQIMFMRSLPARDRDPVLDKFLAAVHAEPSDKLENCLVALPAKRPSAPPATRRTLYVAFSAAILVIGGLAGVVWKQAHDAPVVVPGPTQIPTSKPPGPTFERPNWIVSDVPSSAYCHDMINRLMCVGVSSYRATRDEAVAEATDAALEELVSAVGLKISDPLFRETVLPGYGDVRAKALAALQSGEPDQGSAYAAANDVVTKARKRVVEALHTTGGAAVPSQRSDWYWEEYAAKKGGTEVLVFVRYDIPLDAIKVLVDKYSTPIPVLGSAAVTAFPGLAWRYPDFTGGAMLTKLGRSFADAGLVVPSLVTAVGDLRVADAAGLVRRIEESKQAPGDLKLMVKTDDAPAHVVDIHRQPPR